MKPPDFTYWVPETVIDAIGLLGRLENAQPLAGGQSLMPMLNMRLAAPDHIVDLNEIRDLAYIREDQGLLEIGAMTRQREIERDAMAARACPLLVEALHHIGHRQTRNRGTIGGSLCHLDPSAELAVVATALDATMVASGPDGAREIAFRDFARGYMNPALHYNELLTAVRLPVRSARQGAAFVEFARRHGDFAIVSAAAIVTMGDNERIAKVSLALGGVTEVPTRMPAIENALEDVEPAEATFATAVAPCDGMTALDDVHVSAAYRTHLARVLSRRALTIAARRAQEETA